MSRSRASIVHEWEKLLAACRANPAAVGSVESVLLELEALLAEVRALGIQQDAQTATVQQTSQDIDARVKRGTLLATRLRNAVKAFYGTRTEKVIEFGVRPFRKSIRAPKVPGPDEPKTIPKEEGP